jgi:hypothetical protein
VRVAQLHLVLVEEILCDSALDRLSIVKLEREALHLCGTTGDIAHSIFTAHRAAVRDFDLQAFDFLSEFDTLRIGERFALFVDVADVEHLTHELDDGLSLVESRRRHINVEHHLPLRWTHTLMETEPDFTTAAKRVIIAIGGAEETASDRCVGHAGQVTHDDVQGENCVVGNLACAPFQCFLEVEERHLCDPFDSDAEHAIFAFSGQCHFQFHTVIANWQWVARVQIVAAIKDGFKNAEYFAVRMHHSLDDLAIHLARALVGLNVDVVVMNEAARHRNLEVIGTQQDGPAFAAQIGTSRACENWQIWGCGRCGDDASDILEIQSFSFHYQTMKKKSYRKSGGGCCRCRVDCSASRRC